jgi:hypothetical protein
MRTPSHIAFIAAIAFAIPILASRVLMLMTGPHSSPAQIAVGVLAALLEGIIPGVLVWVGTYVGTRWAAPYQRTVRLAQVLGVLYLVIGVAMSTPIKTHAVLRDMPPPSSSAGPLDFIDPLVASVGAPLIMVVGSLLIARGIATVCGRFNRVAR